ncbi:putative chemotaxis protein PomA [Bacteriovorax sp. BAL6_X]|uniref:motility protein A n=1 Tax=Bacteriovorax sp. BAL6_X TaxID=1201290 RepID=UPI00038659BB|nr:MotA/TolQ/ExbB proton channel family protein [Bacteriovorax sp. BAL6_X]EPZ52013.1 putative chemotaxis protein PomA [Bacteriovorax sp. BAL6_X]
MDIASVIGLVLAVGGIMGSIMSGGAISIFIDVPSVLVVGLGLVGVTLYRWPMEVVKGLVAIAMKSIFFTPVDPKDKINKIKELAELARRESVFALEKAEIDDAFMKKAMTLAADNRPPEVIASILQMDIDSMESRHKTGADVFDGVAADGPAMGMIGTLIGLVQMLQNLSDPSAIGPAMAVALLTTFYGAIIANVFAGPVKNKISYRSQMELMSMSIVVAGTLGIVAGENPRMIIEKLNSFLPPSERSASDEGEE